MDRFDLVFIVLVYRNYGDLEEMLDSIWQQSFKSKAIVVDAFYNEETSNKIKEIALKYNADYIGIPNKGYSYGNNEGIRFALKNYEFDSVIVSNPDIIIEKLPLDVIEKYNNCIIGPKIINLRGKNQNPMYYKKSELALKFVYKGLKSNSKIKFYFGLLLNKLNKMLWNCIYAFKKSVIVYQVHGSFIIIKRNVLTDGEALFDEDMFLFAEESYLAVKMKQQNIPSYYDNRLIVKHKEDGSMKFRNDINERLKEANIYVFEKYYHFGENNEI